jgi:FkbM family methyltransferase
MLDKTARISQYPRLKEIRYRLGMRKYFWQEYLHTGEWELRELHKYVRRDGIALDVGASTGVYAYHLSRMARCVYSFEPNPEYAECIRRLRVRNVLIENVALSSREGQAKLRIPLVSTKAENKGMASLEPRVVADERLSRTIDVPLRRLDNYKFKNVSFIKIDVEGHEEDVLDGGRETIARDRPCLLIEIEERHNPGGLSRIDKSLSALGYEGFYFERGKRRPARTFDSARNQLPSHAFETGNESRRSISYINNFLYCPTVRNVSNGN